MDNKDVKESKFNLKETARNLKYTYSYAKGSRRYLFYSFLGCLLMTAISIIGPILSAQRILKLTSSFLDQLFIVIILIFILEMIRSITRHICNIFANKFFYSVRRNIVLDLCLETLKITTDDLNKNSSGVFIERISNDTGNICDIFIQIVDYTIAILGDIGIFVSVFFINKYMFLVYLFFVIVLFFLHKRAAGINYQKQKIVKKKKESTNGFISELVRGSLDIKVLNAEKSFLSKGDELVTDLGEASFDCNKTRSFNRLINNGVRVSLDFLIGIVAIILLSNNMITIAATIIIYNYQGKILGISSNIEAVLEIIKHYDLAANRIFGILKNGEFNKEEFGDNSISNIKGEIEFKNVSFSYDEDSNVLKNMSFSIKENETVSFVGKSGAGKTTIFNLIASLYKPNKGEILFDGIPISTLNKDSIRGNLSIISQNPYIFNMSIRDNLKIIKEDATEEEMKLALKNACLMDFVNSLKDGMDTIVGEGGVTLSGGQRQRLAIARALLLKTKIILFDEATSALDNETQAEIQKAITNLKGEYTVLIIAHRLSTVINSDKIFVLSNGKIIDAGTHKYLLKNSRTYKSLYTTELEGDM